MLKVRRRHVRFGSRLFGALVNAGTVPAILAGRTGGRPRASSVADPVAARRRTAARPPPNVSALSRVVDLGGPYVSERGGSDDLLDGAVCGVVDEAGYDQGVWQTWCPAEPCDVVSHALGWVGYRHGLGDLV